MKKKKESKASNLKVRKGVSGPPELNPNLERWRPLKKTPLSVTDYIDGILAGERMILSKAITLIESHKEAHRKTANAIIEGCLSHSGQSIRMGITGSPGVGKSTFIEAFGLHLIEEGKKTAILAIDPSSPLSKGSIMGDKTRMIKLAAHPHAFIRPSPSGDSLGGVARKTRETIILCEAAGFDTIIVETVGVGQSETAVHSMVDFFLLLLQPGAGDELQGIKRGIMEMADLIAVNKADGSNLAQAKLAQQQYRNALHMFPKKSNEWIPPSVLCSSLNRKGISEIWKQVKNYATKTKENSYFHINRKNQAQYWLYESINAGLRDFFYNLPQVKDKLRQLELLVLDGKLSSFKAAEEIMGLLHNFQKNSDK